MVRTVLRTERKMIIGLNAKRRKCRFSPVLCRLGLPLLSPSSSAGYRRESQMPSDGTLVEFGLASSFRQCPDMLRSCDQAFTRCCLFCVRVGKFARPKVRLAAIDGPHATAAMASKCT